MRRVALYVQADRGPGVDSSGVGRFFFKQIDGVLVFFWHCERLHCVLVLFVLVFVFVCLRRFCEHIRNLQLAL